MTNKDFCFLGLLALACVLFDSLAEEEGAEAPLPAPRRTGACPRAAAHAVRARADGALWCFDCDRGYFPRVPEWDSALRPLAA